MGRDRDMSDCRRRCVEKLEIGSPARVFECELIANHRSKWHRCESARLEWREAELWLIPPGAA